MMVLFEGAVRGAGGVARGEAIMVGAGDRLGAKAVLLRLFAQRTDSKGGRELYA